jgi:YVTN family beta-propeller protein
VTNAGSGTVAVIDITAAPPGVVSTVPVGPRPEWAAFTPDGTRVYVSNFGGTTVTVIDATTAPHSVLATVTGLDHPFGIAATPDGTRAYVVNTGVSGVSVIDTDSTSPTFNTIVATISLGVTLPCQNSGIRSCPGVAVSPDGTRVYVTLSGSNVVSVIDADPTSPTFNTVVASVTVGNAPRSIGFTPDASRGYVTDSGTSSNNVSVVDTDPTSPTFHTVLAMIPVGNDPWGVAFTPDGTQAYVSNFSGNTVSVIDTTASPPAVVNTVTVGALPLGVSITPF